MKKTQLIIGTLIFVFVVWALSVFFKAVVYSGFTLIELEDPTKPTVAIWIALFAVITPIMVLLKPKQFKGLEQPIAVIPISYVFAYIPSLGGGLIMVFYGLENFGIALVYVSIVFIIIFLFKTLRIYSEEEEKEK